MDRVGVVAGIALAAKHSTVLLAPMLLVLLGVEFARSWWSSRQAEPAERRQARLQALSRAALALVVIALIAIAVLWSFYGFRYYARPAGLALSPTLEEYVVPLAHHEAHAILFLAHYHILPEAYLYGLADVRIMANGMPSYFFGHVHAHGVWFYFPILFLIKNTLAMLALLLIALIAILSGWFENRRALWFLLVPPVLYMGVAMNSHLNIGARHIMPVFVFACALAGATAARLLQRSRPWAVVAVLLLAMHVASSLHAYPNGMAYANEAWGGPSQTYRYISDSNTDWGQQLIATSAYLRDRGITNCWFAYFVAPIVQPRDYGIPCNPLPTPDTVGSDVVYDVPPVITGTVLISAGDLNGFESGSSILNAYESFRTMPQVTSIQDGIHVFQGSFAVPLASAMGHVTQSELLLRNGKIDEALREARIAQNTAPGEVTTEIALGDALVASHQETEAREAYARARTRINEMDPDARDQWIATLNGKLRKISP
jgi:hypothetical protein